MSGYAAVIKRAQVSLPSYPSGGFNPQLPPVPRPVGDNRSEQLMNQGNQQGRITPVDAQAADPNQLTPEQQIDPTQPGPWAQNYVYPPAPAPPPAPPQAVARPPWHDFGLPAADELGHEPVSDPLYKQFVEAPGHTDPRYTGPLFKSFLRAGLVDPDKVSQGLGQVPDYSWAPHAKTLWTRDSLNRMQLATLAANDPRVQPMLEAAREISDVFGMEEGPQQEWLKAHDETLEGLQQSWNNIDEGSQALYGVPISVLAYAGQKDLPQGILSAYQTGGAQGTKALANFAARFRDPSDVGEDRFWTSGGINPGFRLTDEEYTNPDLLAQLAQSSPEDLAGRLQKGRLTGMADGTAGNSMWPHVISAVLPALLGFGFGGMGGGLGAGAGGLGGSLLAQNLIQNMNLNPNDPNQSWKYWLTLLGLPLLLSALGGGIGSRFSR